MPPGHLYRFLLSAESGGTSSEQNIEIKPSLIFGPRAKKLRKITFKIKASVLNQKSSYFINSQAFM